VQPDTDTLRRFVLGQLDAAASVAVERWLADDPAAPATLQAVATSDDTLVASLRGREPAADSPSVAEVIGRAAALREDTTPTGRDVPSAPEAPATTEVGPLVLGGFRVGRLLGAGGMGQVYEAHDPHLDRRVAVKVIHPQVAADPKARARFLREAKAAAAVEHDHVVPILQVGQDGGCLYLAMPYLRGESLADRLRRPEPVPLADVLQVGREAAAGLSAAHARGLVHRDVKPANLWLESLPDGRWRVKILDFGLAHHPEAGDVSEPGAILGTPTYMAPEQARGDRVDARADLYSLGCVLYRLCTGRVPFPGESTMSVLVALAVETPTPTCDLNPAVPPRLGRLIDRLLAKRPEDRPASADAVAAELREIERDGVAVPPVPVPRRRSRGVLAVAAILVLLGGAAFAVYQFAVVTPDGTFVVEVNDPAIEARFKHGELHLFDGVGKRLYTLRPSERNKALPAGEYRLEILGADGLKLVSDEFTITRGKETLVRVRLSKRSGMPDGAKPFVLLRDGKTAGEYRAAAEALFERRAGDVVEVRGDGPFVLPQLTVGPQGLHLRAAAGFRPRFDAAADHDRDRPWVAVRDGVLRLEGCDFHAPSLREPAFVGTGSWDVRSCRLTAPDGYGLIDFAGAKLTVADSLVVGGYQHQHLIRLTGPASAEFRHCVFSDVSETLFRLGGGRPKLRLERCSVHALYAVTADGETDVALAGCAVATWGLLVGERQGVRWSGDGNLYQAWGYLLSADRKRQVETLDDWRGLWGDAEKDARSTTAAPFFALDAFEWPTAASLPVMATWKLPAAPKAGPVWDQVGPGEAYVRALGDGRGDVRPAPLDGGPVVLVRDGKPVRGYLDLTAATAAVAPGDVIELRTDRPTGTVADVKSLAVRAAPGYRPVLGEKQAFRSVACSFEGVHFAAELRLTTGSARFVNCSLDMPVGRVAGPSPVQVVVGEGGGTVEVVRSLFPALDVVATRAVEIRVSGSVVERLRYWTDAGRDADVQVTLERSYSGGVYQRGFHPAAAQPWKGDVADVRAEGCLFGIYERVLGGPKGCFRWSGDRNVYLNGLPRRVWMFECDQATQLAFDLAAWRKLWGGDAASAEVPSPLHDPAQWRLMVESPPVGADLGRVVAPR